MYEANVDDVGYSLVALYTPVREDGVEGQPVSASTDPIAVGKYNMIPISVFIFFLLLLYFSLTIEVVIIIDVIKFLLNIVAQALLFRL